jgi:His-Xaa-Ser system protein HxsD
MMDVATSRRDDGDFVITLGSGVYRCSAVKKAAYKFTHIFHIVINHPDPSATVVTLRPKSASADAEAAVGDFLNEVLDQDLRECIAEETNSIRDLILAQAFSQVSVFHPELDRTAAPPDGDEPARPDGSEP